jgi:zinc protease
VRCAGIAGLAALLALGCNGFGQRPAWEEPPPPPREGPVVPAGALHRSVLESGLQVLVLEDRSLPRVAMGLVIPRGAASVPVQQAGLASYTTELMNRGAGERDALAFAQAVDALGASVSAGSGWDTAVVSASGLARDFEALSELAADVALRPRFEPAEAERLRSQRLAALERAKDDPGTLARRRLAQVLFEGHAYGLPQAGTPETVAGFAAAAARSAHAGLFVPQGRPRPGGS